MRRVFAIFRKTLHIVAVTVGIIMLSIYFISHYNLTGMMIDEDIQLKLCEKFQTKVEIGSIEVNWFNQIGMNHIVIYDQKEDTLFFARRATIALEAGPLLRRKLVINTVQLIDFQLYITKDSLKADPNYTFLVEAIMPKAEETQQRKFINDITLNALLLRQGVISYDVLDQPVSTRSFLPDPNHIYLTDVSARLGIDVSHITGLLFNLKRLSMEEKSGFKLEELKGGGHLSGDSLFAQNISLNISKILDDGYKATLNSHGDFLSIKDTLMFQFQHFDIDASSWGNLHTKLAFSISNKTIEYDAAFSPSYLRIDAIQDICRKNQLEFIDTDNIWLNQIKEIQWDGILTGQTLEHCTFDGHISTEGILQSDLTSTLEYTASKADPISAKVDGTVASILYNNHKYEQIQLTGDYHDNTIHIDFDCKDPLCNMAGQSLICKKDQSTDIQGFVNVNNFHPAALHMTDLENLEDLSFKGIVNLNINIPNNRTRQISSEKNVYDLSILPTGYARIDSLFLIGNEDVLNVGTIRMTNQKEQKTTVFAIVSQIGHIVGTPTSLIGYIPTMPELAHLLHLKGEPKKDITIQIEWDSIQNTLKTELNVPEWTNDQSSYSLYLSGNGRTDYGSPFPQELKTEIDLTYKTSNHSLQTQLSLLFDPDPLMIKMEPSTITIDGKPFSTSDAIISENGNDIFTIENLKIKDKDQEINISGLYSREGDTDLDIELNQWKIDFFLDMLHKGYLDFGGYATGLLRLTSDSILQLQANNLQIDSFTYINTNVGKTKLNGYYDLEKDHLSLLADINSYSGHTTHANCDVVLGTHDTLDLSLSLDSLPIDFVSYWIGGAVQDIHGHGSGEIRLYGDCDSLNLVGHPLLQNVNFTHDLLGARFYITDTLDLESYNDDQNGFVGLNNVRIRDQYGQEAILTLDLEHHHLHNMEYGLDLDIPTTNNGWLIYDHPTQQNGDYYWGRLWATGRCQMHGTYSRHRISIQMSPAGRSTFNLSPGEENFTDNAYNFLSFRDKHKVILEEESAIEQLKAQTFEKEEEKEEPIYVEADLHINANEKCQIYVQLDPLAEDRLTCRGSGDLALHYDPYHDITLTGVYDITSGSYTVNMKGDVMTKAFQLQKDSRVTFPGSPEEAELDLYAIYNIPSANLKDLDESFASVASLNRTTLPVDCKLNVTGQIKAPQISFDLEVKNVSDDVQALVHNFIGNQEMLNREVFYLLLFSKFYTPEYASTSQRQTGSELTSFASSSLTSQLNNLLGHISDNFTLGTNFRSDKGDFSDMEMDVSVSTRLLNDRLLMTGNIGYRDPANSVNMNTNNNAFIGDFDVEFLINTKGTVRAKAYSHSNERDYSINNALTTQGIGIILRKDFNSIRELLKRKQQISK